MFSFNNYKYQYCQSLITMSYQIELRHLHYFGVLAEELHFRKAAERLFISQPGLTRQIKQMEERYGVELFERNKRSVALTAAGRYLKEEVDSLFVTLRRVDRHIRTFQDGGVMELKVGFIGSAVQSVLAQLLVTLKHDYPLFEVDLQELSNNTQLDKLLREELDFGFVRLDEVPKGLSSLSVLTEHFLLAVPRDFPIQQENFVSLKDFSTEPFILFSKNYSHSYYDLVMSIFSDAGFVPKVALRTVNALSIFNLVEQGLGVAIVPASLKRGYTTLVNFIDLGSLKQRTTLSLLWSQDSMSKAKTLFLQIMKEELEKEDLLKV